MKTHELKLIEKYFDLVKNNTKKYELRMNDEKRKEIRIGDEICFLKIPDLEECLYKKVKNLHHFDTFAELADSIDVNLAGFSSKEELVSVMNEIYATKLNEYKILAIELDDSTKQ